MIRVYVGVGLLLLAMLGTWAYGHRQFDAGVASMQAKLDHQRVQDAFDQTEAMDEIARHYEQERINEIPRIAPRIVVSLRAGTLQLRDEWTVQGPTAALPDGGAALRAADSGALVQAGAEADAQVRGLQAALNVCTGRADPPASP